MMRRPTRLLLLAMLLAAARPSPAIIFHSTGDPAYNTNAPTGTLTNSGWQYTGRWGDFMGTVIAPRYFITAKHIATPGTYAGDPFTFQGQTYTALTNYDDPNSDLKIWRVCGTFPPPYAPLYTVGGEVNQGVIIIGRGTERGAEVRAGLTNDLKGWEWGANTSVQRWGSNRVHSTFPAGAGLGFLIRMKFDANAGPDEGHPSYGDSGGPVFYKDNSTWKLAGITYASDGYYSTNGANPGFYAAVFDEGGLYDFNPATQLWTPIADLPADVPGTAYATRIADVSHRAWINSILNQSPPPEPPPVLQSGATVNASFADEPGAVVNTVNRTITISKSGAQRFYRLRACAAYRLAQITLNDANVVLTYE